MTGLDRILPEVQEDVRLEAALTSRVPAPIDVTGPMPTVPAR